VYTYSTVNAVLHTMSHAAHYFFANASSAACISASSPDISRFTWRSTFAVDAAVMLSNMMSDSELVSLTGESRGPKLVSCPTTEFKNVISFCCVFLSR
jgi:hypothetical protein